MIYFQSKSEPAVKNSIEICQRICFKQYNLFRNWLSYSFWYTYVYVFHKYNIRQVGKNTFYYIKINSINKFPKRHNSYKGNLIF